MQTKVTYIASDGTEFNSAEECRNYENFSLFDYIFEDGTVNLWDKDFNPTTDYMKSQYMYVPDLKAKDKFNAWCKSKGFYNLLDKSGAYYCYNAEESWIPFASLYQWVMKFRKVLPADYLARLD